MMISTIQSSKILWTFFNAKSKVVGAQLGTILFSGAPSLCPPRCRETIPVQLLLESRHVWRASPRYTSLVLRNIPELPPKTCCAWFLALETHIWQEFPLNHCIHSLWMIPNCLWQFGCDSLISSQMQTRKGCQFPRTDNATRQRQRQHHEISTNL